MGKKFFEIEGISGLMEQPENTVVGLIAEGTSTYLYGVHNKRNVHLGELATIMTQRGESTIRIGAELVGRLFDISPHAAAHVVDKTVEYCDPYGETLALTSTIAGRLAEGFIEANQPELAAGLFDLRVTHPTVQEEVLEYLLKKDSDITNKN